MDNTKVFRREQPARWRDPVLSGRTGAGLPGGLPGQRKAAGRAAAAPLGVERGDGAVSWGARRGAGRRWPQQQQPNTQPPSRTTATSDAGTAQRHLLREREWGGGERHERELTANRRRASDETPLPSAGDDQ